MEKFRKVIATVITVATVIISIILLRDNGYYIPQDANPYPMLAILSVGGVIALFLWFGEKAIPWALIYTGIVLFLGGMFGGIICTYYWGVVDALPHFFVGIVLITVLVLLGLSVKKLERESA